MEIAKQLIDHSFDIGILRPFRMEGRNWITVRKDGKLITEETDVEAPLTKEQWERLDDLILRYARKASPTVCKLRLLGHDFLLPQHEAMGKLQIETEPETPMPEHKLESVPLPITHIDFENPFIFEDDGSFYFNANAITAAAEMGRSLEEQLLQTILTAKGALTANDPGRARELLAENHYYGPYLEVAIPPRATVSMDGLRQPTKAVVQATPDVVRMVVGIEPTPVWWNGHYKIITIIVPQVRRDLEGRTGICLVSN